MKSELHVDIDRPIEEVFHNTLDHVSEWSITAIEDEVIEDTGGVGTTFRLVTEDRGQRIEFEGVVTKYEKPTLSEARMTSKQFDIVAEYRFEDLGNGRTRVTQNAQVFGHGFFKVMFLLFGWAFKKSSCDAQTNELESLKKFCEEKAAAGAAG